MSDDEKDTQGVAVSMGAVRVQHVVLHGPADSRTMAAALRPAIERSREVKGNGAPACLVITPTIEQALAISDLARTLFDDDTNRVVPVTAVVRATRVLQSGPVAVVAGIPHDLLALRSAAALDLESLRAVVLIGLDDLLTDGSLATLQSVLGDVPVDAMRIATLDADSPATESFFEAHLRRARHVNSMMATDTSFAVTPRYAVSTPAARAELLRAVLDEIDPPSLAIVAVSEVGETDARRALARIGVAINGDAVSVARHAPKAPASLVVLWEAPGGAEALTEAVAGRPAVAIAFLLPDEVPSFHRLTGGAAQPWTPTVRKDSIESRARTLRTALRSTLANGGASASELALLAPLLDSHDAVEIAAAALRLYEGARREATTLRARGTAAETGSSSRGTSTAAAPSAPLALVSNPGVKARVFFAVGKRDGVQTRDIVGAVANEAGIDGSAIGSVSVFESHTTVELAADDAKKVIEMMANTELRGRRVGARIDEREARSGAYGRSEGGERPTRSFGPPRDRGGDRGGSRGASRDRDGERSARAPRSFGPPRDRADRGERSERPARQSFGSDRGEPSDRERPARPAFGADRAERGERSSRSAFGGERGERGATSRGSSEGRPARSFGAAAGRSDSRGDSRGGSSRDSRSESRGEPRANDVRRSFGDRPATERTESRREWSSRGDSMKNAKRTPRKSPGTFDEI